MNSQLLKLNRELEGAMLDVEFAKQEYSEDNSNYNLTVLTLAHNTVTNIQQEIIKLLSIK